MYVSTYNPTCNDKKEPTVIWILYNHIDARVKSNIIK